MVSRRQSVRCGCNPVVLACGGCEDADDSVTIDFSGADWIANPDYDDSRYEDDPDTYPTGEVVVPYFATTMDDDCLYYNNSIYTTGPEGYCSACGELDCGFKFHILAFRRKTLTGTAKIIIQCTKVRYCIEDGEETSHSAIEGGVWWATSTSSNNLLCNYTSEDSISHSVETDPGMLVGFAWEGRSIIPSGNIVTKQA